MAFRICSTDNRTVVFENEHGDRFTSRFMTNSVEGMRSDVEWSDSTNLPPREGRNRLGPADEFAMDYAHREGWISP